MRNRSEPARVIVIGGPTASGKSQLAADVAQQRNGVVINADSMQLYAALPILSASPAAAMTAQAPHRLYGVLPPDRLSTVAVWAVWVRAEIKAAFAEGRQPVVVGGTGLYLEALVEGLSAIPAIPDAARAGARADLASMGHAAFHQRLVAADPASARLAPGDTHRILRAWEVFQATGRTLASWQGAPIAADRWQYRCVAVVPPRADLYRACDERLRAMIGQGALEEVAALIAAGGAGWPITRTLGARPLIDHLQGRIDRETALQLAQAATRHYAKRQTTWFRNRFMRGGTAILVETAREALTVI